jgi:two-component system response regulator MprA
MAQITGHWGNDARGVIGVRRILIVEDNPDLRTVLTDALLDTGYDVSAVSNGAEALALVDEWLPDAILLDLMMPIMDGADFLRARRDRPFLARVPVMVLTANPFHHRTIDGLGATLVLRKPYDLEELLAAVEALCAGEAGRGNAS